MLNQPATALRLLAAKRASHVLVNGRQHCVAQDERSSIPRQGENCYRLSKPRLAIFLQASWYRDVSITAPSTQRYGIVVCNATMRTSTIRSAPDDFILAEEPDGAAFWLAWWLELTLVGMVRSTTMGAASSVRGCGSLQRQRSIATDPMKLTRVGWWRRT